MPNFDDFYWDNGIFDDTSPVSTPVFTGALVWICGVEWTGSYTGISEPIIDYSMERGSAYTIAASGGGFEPIGVGSCTVKLNNSDNRYDPYNTGSPLYPNVVPGKKMFIDAVDTVTNIHYQRFAGRIENIIPDPLTKTVTLECKDYANDLERDDITLPIKFSTNTSDALADVLNGISWGHGTSIQTSDNPLILFSVDEQNGLGVVDQLVQGSLGFAFVSKNGTFTYYDRAYNSMASHSVDQAIVAKDLPVKSPWDTTRKNIAVYANKWARTQIKTIWTCPDSLYLLAFQTKTFDIELANPCLIIPPVLGLDYPETLGNSAIDVGAGTVTVVNLFTVTISNVTGKGCTISATNHSMNPVSLHGLRLRGREYVQSYSTKQQRGSYVTWVPTPAQDTSTKKKYTRTNGAAGGKFVLDSPYLQDGNFADAYAASISTALETADKAPTLKFDTRGSEAFPIEIGDKIVVTSAFLGINATFYAVKIVEHWTDGQGTGQGYETVVYTGRRIFCTDSITPEPIPDGGDGEGPITTIPTDPTLPPTKPGAPPETYPDACLIDPLAPGTGPYPLQFDRTTIYPGQSAFAMFPCGLRKAGAINGSYLDLYGAAAFGNSYQFYQTFAVDSNKTRILTGVHDNGYFDVTSTFGPAGGMSVAGFEVFLPVKSLDYQAGNTVYTSEGVEGLIYPHPPSPYTNDPDLTWPNHTDTANFRLRSTNAPDLSRLDAIIFDLGAKPSNNTMQLGVRARGISGGPSGTHPIARFWTSNDGITYRTLSTTNDFGGANLNTWMSFESSVGAGGGDYPDRFVGLFATDFYGVEIDIAYFYILNSSLPITGYITLGNQNRAWNICAIPED